MQILLLTHARLGAHLRGRLGAAAGRRDERGDVPGWVLVTVMSVGVVAALTPLVSDELQNILRRALSSVGN